MWGDRLLRPIQVRRHFATDFVFAWTRLNFNRTQWSDRHPEAILVVLGVNLATCYEAQSRLEIFNWVEAWRVEISHHLVCRHLRMLLFVVLRLSVRVVKVDRHDFLWYFVPELMREDVLISPFLVEGAHVVLFVLARRRVKR